MGEAMDKGLFLFCIENLSDYIKRALGGSVFSVEEILANQREVGRWLGLGARFRFDGEAALRSYERAAAFLDSNPNVRFCVFPSPLYPSLLRHSRQAPWGVFFAGSIANDWERTLAAVGTRRPMPCSLRDAYRFGVECGLNGINIASGFAQGLDRALMKGCLDGGGRTFGVLGCGLGRRPFRETDRLGRRIEEGGGALISQFPPLDGGFKFHFPIRNHTLSLLCRSVVAFQAPARSGVLGTTRWALDEGRDVYVHDSALAGGPDFAGSRSLAEDGAPVIRSPSNLFPDAPRTVRAVRYNPLFEKTTKGLFRMGGFWFQQDWGSGGGR